MNKYHKWSENDMEILERNYGRIGADTLCKKLGINYAQLRNKVKALGLGYQREADEFLTMRQLREIMGIQHYKIQTFIRYGLPVIKMKFGNGNRYNILINTSNHIFSV